MLKIVFALLFASIFETPNFSELAKYNKPQSLIILDIDDTLLIPTQTLGTDVWFRYQLQKYKKEGLEDPLDKALAEWESVRHVTNVQLVEPHQEDIVEALQDKGAIIMGLTTQGLALATRTVKQLHLLGIDLSKSAPCIDDHYFLNPHGVLYRNGILFTAGTDKGEALLKLLKTIDYHPKEIIFINDKKTHLEEVAKVVEKAGIKFTGLRYSFSDERVNNFDPLLAEIEFNFSSFNRILSDEEAKEVLKALQEDVER